MTKFLFTIITAVYNSEKFLAESIESVMNQSIGFKDNIQLILVDDGSSDCSRMIAKAYQEKYPDNILVLLKENGGVATARNLGLEYVEGKYVNFLDSDDKLSLNALSVVKDFFDSHEDIRIVSMPLIFFDKRQGGHYLNYKFEEEGVIDLKEKYDYPQMHISSSFIEHTLIKDYRFNPQLVNGSDSEVLNRILIDIQKYGVVNRAQYNYRKRQDSTSIMDNAMSSKRFFTEKLRLYHKRLIDESITKNGNVTKYVQYLVALELAGIVKSPYFNKVFNTKEEVNEFWVVFCDVLRYIPVDIIINHRYITKDVQTCLMFVKNDDFHSVLKPKKARVFLKSGEYVVNKLHNHNIHMDQVKINNGQLELEGFFASNCEDEYLTFNVITDNRKIRAKHIKNTYEGRETKCFLGFNWKFFYNFKVTIPLKDTSQIRLEMVYHEGDVEVLMKPDIRMKDYCGITESKNYVYDKSKIVYFKDNMFTVENNSLKKKLKLKLMRCNL